jgi:hypothetical protein
VVRPDWIDYNGHMNAGYYHVAFDIVAEEFFQFLGFTPEFRERHGATTLALEAHLNFLREVKAGDALRFDARRRTAPMPQELVERLSRIKAAHATLPRLWQVGHVISARPLR